MFYEVSIQAAHSGFGEYQTLPSNGEGWADKFDLLAEIEGNGVEVVELKDGVTIPEGADDIRGRIHNEPDSVFVGIDGERVFYFGISEK